MPVPQDAVPLLHELIMQRDGLQQQYDAVNAEIISLQAESLGLAGQIQQVENAISNIEAGNNPAPVLAQTDITAVTAGDSSLELEWDAVANATQYRLQTSTNGQDWQDVYTGPETDYVDTDLINLQVYFYRCRGEANGYQPGPWSDVQAGQPNLGTLDQVEMQEPVITANSILLIWDAVADAETYYIQTSRDGGQTWQDLALTANTQYLDQPLLPDTEYWYQITPRAGGWFQPSPTPFSYVTASGSEQLPTPAITDFTPKDSVTVPELVVVFTAQVTGISGLMYQFQASTDPTFAVVDYEQMSATYSNNITIHGAGIYYFRCRLTAPGYLPSEWKVADEQGFYAT